MIEYRSTHLSKADTIAAMSGAGHRRWQPEENIQLQVAVANAGAKSLNWQEIAAQIPGRTERSCRRRWETQFSKVANTGRWESDEDDRLSQAVQRYGNRWSRIAEEVGTRMPDQCSSRWLNCLDPRTTREEWLPEEDKLLLKGVEQFDRSWTKIAKAYLTKRTPLALRNRYSHLMRRKNSSRSSAGEGSSGQSKSPRQDHDRSLSAVAAIYDFTSSAITGPQMWVSNYCHGVNRVPPQGHSMSEITATYDEHSPSNGSALYNPVIMSCPASTSLYGYATDYCQALPHSTSSLAQIQPALLGSCAPSNMELDTAFAANGPMLPNSARKGESLLGEVSYSPLIGLLYTDERFCSGELEPTNRHQ